MSRVPGSSHDMHNEKQKQTRSYRAATISTISRIANCHQRGDDDNADDDKTILPFCADDCDAADNVDVCPPAKADE